MTKSSAAAEAERFEMAPPVTSPPPAAPDDPAARPPRHASQFSLITREKADDQVRLAKRVGSQDVGLTYPSRHVLKRRARGTHSQFAPTHPVLSQFAAGRTLSVAKWTSRALHSCEHSFLADAFRSLSISTRNHRIGTCSALVEPGRLRDEVIPFRYARRPARGSPVVCDCGLMVAGHFE